MCRESDIRYQDELYELCDVGLSVYRQALANGHVDGEMPECLSRLGLLQPLAENPSVCRPVPPDVAASELCLPLEQSVFVQQQAIATLRGAIAPAEDIYREELRESASSVRLLHGAEVVEGALRRAADACVAETLTAQPGGGRDVDLLERALPRALELNRRGVKQRTLYQHTVRSHGPTLSYIEQVAMVGAEVRTLDDLFDRLIIFDRTTAFIPDPRHESRAAALVIEHPAIVHYLAQVFDHAWRRAEPVAITEYQVRPPLLTEETRHAVLRLMVAGHTDAAIAKRLGMSTRTVSTHIKKSSELFNSHSRAQLAYLLAQSGTLEDIPL